MTTTVHFTTPLGAHISVETNDHLATLRQYGAQGWTSGNIVRDGGLRLPLANHTSFDWRLIGARPSQIKNKQNGTLEDGVWYRGEFFKRRELEAKDSKIYGHQPEAIKYSRGARPSDPPEIREKSGELEYVTLAWFRGPGHLRHYDAPESTASTKEQAA